MFGTARKLLGVFRLSRRTQGMATSRNDDAHLRSSKVNEERLNGAIAELDAGRGKLTSVSKLRGQMREAQAR